MSAPKKGYCGTKYCTGNHIFLNERKGEVQVCVGAPPDRRRAGEDHSKN